jgi:hypothetical protein
MSSIRSKVQLLAVVLACATAACGDDDDNDGDHAHGGATAGSGGGGAAGKAGSAGGAAGKAGSAGAAGKAGGSAAPTADCDTYCALAVGKRCTGDLELYADTAACEEGCAMIDTKGEVTDTEGDTLGCRIYHLTVANMSETNATTHCLHGKVESDTCK